MKILWLGTLVIAMSACSSIPEKLQTPENVTLVEFGSMKEDSISVVGQMARWGGIIALVKNNAENTMVEVVNFPLRSTMRPKQSNETQGRFRLYYDGLLDPVIYQKGKKITAVGTIVKSENGHIGEHEYQFPVLKASGVHLWKDIEKIETNIRYNPFLYSNSYYSPYNLPSYYYRRAIISHRSTGATSKSQSTTKDK